MLKRAIALQCALLMMATGAIAQTTLNDPTADWGIASAGPHDTVADTGVPGGKATRIEATGAGDPWAVSGIDPIQQAISKGDHIVVKVWIKADVSTQINYRVETRGAPWTALGEMPAAIGTQWEEKTLDFVASDNFPADSTQVTLHLNTAKQTIWLGPVTVTKQ